MNLEIDSIVKLENRPEPQKLFRTEIMIEQSSQWLGPIRLAQPVATWLITVVSLCLSFADIQHITVGDQSFWAGEKSGSYILHHNIKDSNTYFLPNGTVYFQGMDVTNVF